MGQKTFYYKVASLDPDDGTLTLQDHLQAIYKQAPKPHQRKQRIKDALGEDTKERNVIAYRTEHQDMSCGIMQHYKEGAPVLASVHSDDDDNYAMVQLPPPVQADAKKRTEFVKHLLYFAVRGNHVVYIHTRGISSEDLENHLNWLLNKFNANGKKAAPQLALDDSVPAEYRNKALQNVRSIALYSEPEVQAIVPAQDSKALVPQTQQTSQQTWSINDDPLIEGFLGLLRQWRPGTTKNEVFKLDDAFKKGTLRAKIVLDFVDGGKGNSSPLDPVAHNLRHVDGLKFDMTLPNKEPLKSVDTKVKRTYHVQSKDELLIPESAFTRMSGMLENLVKANDVAPDP